MKQKDIFILIHRIFLCDIQDSYPYASTFYTFQQGWNPVLNDNCKNVCLEGVALYHTDGNPTPSIKGGILYQCDPTSSNQSASHPLSSSQKRAQNDCWSRVGCPGTQTSLCAWHNPKLRSCPCQRPAREHGPWTGILPQFSHSFYSKCHRLLQVNYLSYLKLYQWLKGHCQPLLCCLFSYCFCQFTKSS